MNTNKTTDLVINFPEPRTSELRGGRSGTKEFEINTVAFQK